MIKYRPHRGLLEDTMKEARNFNTVNEMCEHIVSDWNNNSVGELFSKEDIVIGEDEGKDSRIDWKETRYICVKRMGKEIYEIPQCIGMCSIED